MAKFDRSGPNDPVRTAVRFPLHLDVNIRWDSGELHAVTENVSSNGILFAADPPLPVGSFIQFTMVMPAAVMGSPEDVKLECAGRIVRQQKVDGKTLVAAVIDEYSLKADHS